MQLIQPVFCFVQIISPKIEHLYLIGDFFNTSLDWLIKGTDKSNISKNEINTLNDTDLSAIEANIIKIYRDLDRKYQQEIIDFIYELKTKSKLSTSTTSENETSSTSETA